MYLIVSTDLMCSGLTFKKVWNLQLEYQSTDTNMSDNDKNNADR